MIIVIIVIRLLFSLTWLIDLYIKVNSLLLAEMFENVLKKDVYIYIYIYKRHYKIIFIIILIKKYVIMENDTVGIITKNLVKTYYQANK